MTPEIEISVAVFILIGTFFMFVGSFGLFKLPDLMTRIHGPTKATTLGIGAILVASILIVYGLEQRISIKEILIIVFLFGTAPISAHFISRAYLHMNCSNPQEELPGTCCPYQWSMFEKEPLEKESEVRAVED
jgi:multicomponent K+:H+ antiporter subunit G